jgi:hypothetical protein
MNRLSKRLDQAGFNPRLMLLVAGFALLIGNVISPLLQDGIAFGIVRRSQVYQVDLKCLGSFPFNDQFGTIKDIPPAYRNLDGKQISLEGFMKPLDSSGDQLSRFEFVYDPHRRYGTLRQEMVFVSVRGHKVVDYVPDQEVRIVGTLHVKVSRDPDTRQLESIYTLDLDRIEPL